MELAWKGMEWKGMEKKYKGIERNRKDVTIGCLRNIRPFNFPITPLQSLIS